jgi:SagB-type dehydrogenase family enzyme
MMKGESHMRYILGILFLLVSAVIVTAQELKPIQLPVPDTTGGKTLMQALQDRHSTRDFNADTLTLPVLSNLVWAAGGVNRTGEGKRTAPSAMNKQEIDLYLATANGLYLYDPAKHALQHLLPADIREKTGIQDFVKDVPLNIIYVADYDKMSGSSDNEKTPYAYADAAFMAENVYLICASQGLGTVVRGSIKHPELEKAMNLRANQHIILAQSVGFPKK